MVTYYTRAILVLSVVMTLVQLPILINLRAKSLKKKQQWSVLYSFVNSARGDEVNMGKVV